LRIVCRKPGHFWLGANRQQIFASALTHHQAGKPIEADAACRALLAHWPHDVDALNLRAVIACMAGRYANGTVLLEQVLARRPDDVQALSTLGDALHLMGDSQGSIATFERAVKLAPRDTAGLDGCPWPNPFRAVGVSHSTAGLCHAGLHDASCGAPKRERVPIPRTFSPSCCRNVTFTIDRHDSFRTVRTAPIMRPH
jgi:tetratricopeptide (TPR) repeat protein